LLDMRSIRNDGFLDSRRVQACWQEHLTGRRDQSRYLWSVLMIQSWLAANRNERTSRPAAHAAAQRLVEVGP
jgi:asparagine synthase (glutamine-hydrolysing)